MNLLSLLGFKRHKTYQDFQKMYADRYVRIERYYCPDCPKLATTKVIRNCSNIKEAGEYHFTDSNIKCKSHKK